MVPGDDVEKLATPAASRYLRQRGLRVQPTTLSQWRWKKKGPPYYRELMRVYYRPADLSAFAAASTQRIEPAPAPGRSSRRSPRDESSASRKKCASMAT
jgi:hypothetical protein